MQDNTSGNASFDLEAVAEIQETVKENLLLMAVPECNKPSVSRAQQDISRMDLYINKKAVLNNKYESEMSTDKKIEKKSIFGIYKEHIEDEAIAWHFALNNHQHALYEFLDPIVGALRSVISENKGLNSKDPVVSAAAREWEIAAQASINNDISVVKIEKTGDSYKYTFEFRHPVEQDQVIFSGSVEIKHEENFIVYENPKIILGDLAKQIGFSEKELNKGIANLKKAYPIEEANKIDPEIKAEWEEKFAQYERNMPPADHFLMLFNRKYLNSLVNQYRFNLKAEKINDKIKFNFQEINILDSKTNKLFEALKKYQEDNQCEVTFTRNSDGSKEIGSMEINADHWERFEKIIDAEIEKIDIDFKELKTQNQDEVDSIVSKFKKDVVDHACAETLKDKGIMAAYDESIKDEKMALHFALLDHKKAFYDSLDSIASAMDKLLQFNQNITEEERLVQSNYIKEAFKNPQVSIQAVKGSKNSYEYIFSAKYPRPEKEICSVKFLIEKNGKDLIYKNPKITLSETAEKLGLSETAINSLIADYQEKLINEPREQTQEPTKADQPLLIKVNISRSLVKKAIQKRLFPGKNKYYMELVNKYFECTESEGSYTLNIPLRFKRDILFELCRGGSYSLNGESFRDIFSNPKKFDAPSNINEDILKDMNNKLQKKFAELDLDDAEQIVAAFLAMTQNGLKSEEKQDQNDISSCNVSHLSLQELDYKKDLDFLGKRDFTFDLEVVNKNIFVSVTTLGNIQSINESDPEYRGPFEFGVVQKFKIKKSHIVETQNIATPRENLKIVPHEHYVVSRLKDSDKLLGEFLKYDFILINPNNPNNIQNGNNQIIITENPQGLYVIDKNGMKKIVKGTNAEKAFADMGLSHGFFQAPTDEDKAKIARLIVEKTSRNYLIKRIAALTGDYGSLADYDGSVELLNYDKSNESHVKIVDNLAKIQVIEIRKLANKVLDNKDLDLLETKIVERATLNSYKGVLYSSLLYQERSVKILNFDRLINKPDSVTIDLEGKQKYLITIKNTL